MPDIVAEIVKAYYSSTWSRIVDLIPSISADLLKNNKINIALVEHKVKLLLIHLASVMMPNTVRDWYRKETNGYIVVKKTGELVWFYR